MLVNTTLLGLSNERTKLNIEVIDMKNTIQGLKADWNSLENDNIALKKDLE